MPDAQPKPTAADADLWASRAEQVATEALYASEPDTHPHSTAAFIAARQRVGVVLAALSDAGLLATGEHDAQVLRDAADARDDALLWGDPGPSAWLRARADRIAAGEEP